MFSSTRRCPPLLAQLSHLRPRASLSTTQRRLNAPLRKFSTTPSRLSQYKRFDDHKVHAEWNPQKWSKPTQVTVGVISCYIVYYFVSHLEQVPETGRWRFMDVSQAYETKLGRAANAELLQEYKGRILPPNHPVTRHVHRIVTRILEASQLGTLKTPGAIPTLHVEAVDPWDPDTTRVETAPPGTRGLEWELIVVNDDRMVNAMTSFGNIVVFTGILPVARDEEGLAAVLGHEIGHSVARHVSERYSSLKIILGLATLLEWLQLDFGLARIGMTLLYELPNGRQQELEADEIGLKLMATACYDPSQSVEMFTRLAKFEGKGISFLNTHPSSKKRIERLQEKLPEAYAIQAASPECGGVNDSLAAFRDTFGILQDRWT